MTSNYQALQDNMVKNDLRLTANFQTVVQEMDMFKQQVHAEQDMFQNSLPSAQGSSSSNSNNVSLSVPSLPTNSSTLLPSTPQVNSAADQNTSSPQNQMMKMMTDTLSKLSIAVVDGKLADTKSDWPKFSGDPKTFKAWYCAILAQLSLSPWQELHDSGTNDIILTTSNTILNGKLYAKLLVSLEGQALQSIVLRKHLRANGLLLLRELTQTYKPKHIPEVIAAKTGIFWSQTKRLPSETVDDYYNRFHDLLDELSETDDPISTKSAMRHFIFTLGTEFSTIQNNFRIGNLPTEWHTQDWPTLLVLCRDFYHSVNPQGILKSDSPSDNHKLSQTERLAHHKKVKQWFLNPTKFRRDIEAEQKKHPGKCIYHLSTSHPTTDYNVKKECDKIISENKNSNTPSTASNGSSGHLRNLKEDAFEDAVSEEVGDVLPDSQSNDTNEEDLYYFARLSNHYLRLVKVSPPVTGSSRHIMQYPIIADSGANFHMFKDREFFETLHPASGNVILGDGKTSLSIKGVGTVKCKIGSHVLWIENVRYIPDLAESIYSLFLHIQCPSHGLHSSFNTGLFIVFPEFRTKDKFQHNVTSGAHFGLQYQPGTFIYRLDESTSIFSPKFALESSVHVHTHSPPSIATIIGLPTYDNPNLYTVVFKDGSISQYLDDILSNVPDNESTSVKPLLPSWIKGGCECDIIFTQHV
jgi:hypothetical protein